MASSPADEATMAPKANDYDAFPELSGRRLHQQLVALTRKKCTRSQGQELDLGRVDRVDGLKMIEPLEDS